jgi:hypothetical protein
MATVGVDAAEWDTSGGVAVASIYTDNVCLTPNDEKGKAIVTVTPDVNLRSTGARADVAVSARVQYNSLAEQDLGCPIGGVGLFGARLQRFTPSGGASANYELIDNWLTLNASATATQVLVNPFAPGGQDGLNGRNNTTLVYRYGAGAQLQRRFDQRVDFNLGYRYDEQVNELNLFGDSKADNVSGSLALAPGSSRLTLGVYGVYSRIEFERALPGLPVDVAGENVLSSAEVRAGFQLTDSWQIDGHVGAESNEYLSLRDEIDGTYWDAGVRWSPNDRVEIAAGTGERFFGETPRFQASYRHKRSELQVSYARTIQFPRDLRSPVFDPDNPFGPGFGGLPGDPVFSPDTPALLGQGPIINEAFALNYRFSGRRTSFSVFARDSEQTRLSIGSIGSDANFRSAQMTATRNLSSRLSASVRVGWNENKGRRLGEVDDILQGVELWTGGLNLTRRFGNDLAVTVAYQYRTQSSDLNLNEFVENRVTISTRLGLF